MAIPALTLPSGFRLQLPSSDKGCVAMEVLNCSHIPLSSRDSRREFAGEIHVFDSEPLGLFRGLEGVVVGAKGLWREQRGALAVSEAVQFLRQARARGEANASHRRPVPLRQLRKQRSFLFGGVRVVDAAAPAAAKRLFHRLQAPCLRLEGVLVHVDIPLRPQPLHVEGCFAGTRRALHQDQLQARRAWRAQRGGRQPSGGRSNEWRVTHLRVRRGRRLEDLRERREHALIALAQELQSRLRLKAVGPLGVHVRTSHLQDPTDLLSPQGGGF